MDGQDEAALLLALGSAAGEPEYRLAADVNRDGQVAADDAALQEGSFGFLANRPPVVTGDAVAALPGIAVSIDLSALSDDPEGDALSFVVSNVACGTVTLVDEGRTAVFTADIGYAGSAGFGFQADDGLARSAGAAVAIDVVDAALENIVITHRDLALSSGESVQLSVVGQFSDGLEVPLPGGYCDYSTTDPSVAIATALGTVIPVGDGTGVIVVTCDGVTAATPVTVGDVTARSLEFYPSTYALVPGQTRQFIVREQLADLSIEDVSSAADGTVYFVSDPAKGTITADGLLTAEAVGRTYVTVIHGSQSAVTPIEVTAPSVGATVVGEQGGIVSNADGISVAAGPGALPEGTTVTITTKTEADMPYGEPFGFTFAGAFELDLGGVTPTLGLTATLPAPAGSSPGDVFYLFHAGEIPDGPGEFIETWQMVDRMVVADDGMVHSTSTPFMSLAEEGFDVMMSPDLISVMLAIRSMGNKAQAVLMVDSPFRGDTQKPYSIFPGFFVDWFFPVKTGIDIELQLRVHNDQGFVSTSTTTVAPPPGPPFPVTLPAIMSPSMNFILPPPEVIDIRLDLGPDRFNPDPEVVLTGWDFTYVNPFTGAPPKGGAASDLTVTFIVGDEDVFDYRGTPIVLGGKDAEVTGADLSVTDLPNGLQELRVPVPREVAVGLCEVTVSRPMFIPDYIKPAGSFNELEFTSWPIHLDVQPTYVFAAGTQSIAEPRVNRVAAIDARSIIEVADPDPHLEQNPEFMKLVSHIPVAEHLTEPGPTTVSATVEGARAYVTLQRAGGVAVIDALSLREVDVDPDWPGVQFIELPPGAAPYWIEASANNEFAYVSDFSASVIYVLDINPFSATYNEHVATIPVSIAPPGVRTAFAPVGTPAPLGLRGLAISADTRRLYVAAPGKTLFHGDSGQTGYLLVVDTDLTSGYLHQQVFQGSIPVGPDPYGVTATTDPNVLLFTDRLGDNVGFNVVRKDPWADAWTVESTSLAGLGAYDNRRIKQVFSISNATGVAYLPENALRMAIGDHPAYAFVSAFNRFIPGDPKHDSNRSPTFVLYPGPLNDNDNPFGFPFSEEGNNVRYPLVAGGNVGIIRDPLGDAQVVAATRNIPEGFLDSLTLAGLGLYVGYRGIDSVFVFNVPEIILTVEAILAGQAYEFPFIDPATGEIDSRDVVIDPQAMQYCPIDDLNPRIDMRADYRLHAADTDGDGKADAFLFGIPAHNPPAGLINPMAPIGTGGVPQGLAAQPDIDGIAIDPRTNPYNIWNILGDSCGLCGQGEGTQPATAPLTSEVELHSGGVIETHTLVTWQSVGTDRGPALVYDSLRADPRPIVHFGYDDVLPDSDPDRRLMAKLEARLGDETYTAAGWDSAVDPYIFNLTGGENFWKVPSSGGRVEAALQIDLREGPTGVYDYDLTHGIFGWTGVSFVGSSVVQREKLVVVNGIDSPFGAGWSLQCMYELVINDDGSVLLISGDGTEARFDAPGLFGSPYVSPPGDYSTLLQSQIDGTFTRRMRDGTVYEFNEFNKLGLVRDRNGNETRYVYDGMGKLLAVIDPAGLSLTFTYTGEKVTAMTDPAGRTTHLLYDSDGNLIEITDPDGLSRSFGYDEDHHLIRETTKGGAQERTFYDFAGRATGGIRADGGRLSVEPAQVKGLFETDETRRPFPSPPMAGDLGQPIGRLVNARNLATETTLNQTGMGLDVTDGVGPTQEVERDQNNLITRFVDAEGNVTEFTYDIRGNLAGIRDPLSGPNGQTYEYDLVYGQMTSLVDEHGRETRYEYDASGNLLVTTRAAGTPLEAVWTHTYTSTGLLDTQTDPVGRITDHDYDTYGRLVKTTRYAGTSDQAVWRFEYDAAGNRTASIGPNGNRTEIEYDAMNRVVLIRDALGGETSYAYNAAGRIVTETDPEGRITRHEYDAAGREIRSVNALGEEVVWEYDAVGNVTVLTDDLGRRTTLGYDERDRRIEQIDPAGGRTRWEYDSGNNSTAIVEPNGARTEYTYDLRNRLIREADALGNAITYEYDPADQLIARTDANGNTTLHEYDALGRVVRVIDPLGGVTTAAYDAADQIVSVTDALGRTTTFAYDAAGRRVGMTDALGHTMATAYDAAGNVVSVTDALGETIEYTYDALYRQIEVTDPLGNTATRAYDAVGNVEILTDALGRITEYQYDALSRVIEIIDELGNTSTTAYDVAGNVLSFTDAMGRTTSYEYDALNRQTAIVAPDGTANALAYDAVGNRVAVSDELDHTSRFVYDLLGRQTQITDGAGGVTSLEYDPNGNLIALTNPAGNVTVYEYDALDRLVREVDPLGASIEYAYDAVGNCVSITDRNGRIREFTHDAVDQLTEERWVEGGAVVNTVLMTYDAAGRTTGVADDVSASSYTYDAGGRLIGVSSSVAGGSHQVVLTCAYDAVGNLLSVSEAVDGQPAAATAWVYDESDRAVRGTQSGGGVSEKRVDLAYDAAGGITDVDRFADLAGTQFVAATEVVYDALGQATRIAHRNATDVVSFFDLVYDAAGRISRITDVDGVTDYTYDALDQLIAADHSDPARSDETYAYDPNGNRTGMGIVTDAADRLLSDGTFEYEYDAEGNLVRRTDLATGAVRELTWDHRNRLVAITDRDPGGTPTLRIDYTYDAENCRIANAVDEDPNDGVAPAVTYFVYDRGNVLLELTDPDGPTGPDPAAVSMRYFLAHGMDNLIAQEDAAGRVLWVLEDHLGSTRDLVDTAGQVANHLTFDSFGHNLTQTDPAAATRYVFTGREYDAHAGFYYFRARYFDPGTGRFLSQDPVRVGGQDVNLYRYVHNAPVHNVDPEGTIFARVAGVVSVAIRATLTKALEIGAKALALASKVGAWVGKKLTLLGTKARAKWAEICKKLFHDSADYYMKIARNPEFRGNLEKAFGNKFTDAEYTAFLAKMESKLVEMEKNGMLKKTIFGGQLSVTVKGGWLKQQIYGIKKFFGIKTKNVVFEMKRGVLPGGLHPHPFKARKSWHELTHLAQEVQNPDLLLREAGLQGDKIGFMELMEIERQAYVGMGGSNWASTSWGAVNAFGAKWYGQATFGAITVGGVGIVGSSVYKNFQPQINQAANSLFQGNQLLAAEEPAEAPPAPAGEQTDLGFEAQVGASIADALALWRLQTGSSPPLSVTYDVRDLPDGQLSEAWITGLSDAGLPVEGHITVDCDANGRGWFIDATPADHIEFSAPVGEAAFIATSGDAYGRYDLLTTLCHELGHLMGFTDAYGGFASHMTADAGRPVFVEGDFRAALTADGDHLDATAFAGDLMTAVLGVSTRRLPSATDGHVLTAAWAGARYASGDVSVRLLAPGERAAQMAAAIGFILLADDVEADAVDPPTGVVNGDFAVSDPVDPQFGWNVHGAVSVQDGRAVLAEGDLLFSDLSQVFVVGAGVTELRLTIASLRLGAAALNPPDAFEVALLNVATLASVLGPLTPLGQTDALLNIQPTGQVFFAPGVAVTGVAASGDVLGGDGPFTVHVDLSGLSAGSTVALFHDLIGFGDDDSTVVIGEVALVEQGIGEPPVATDDQATTDEDIAVEIDVLANDVDTDGTLDPATVAIVAPPTHGQLAIDTATGTVTYTPAADYNGDDSFRYTVRDDDGNVSNVATVTLTVRGVNDAPAAAADSYTVRGDTTLTVAAPGVLANDTDIDGDALTAAAVSPPSHGQLTLSTDGSFEYTPDAGYIGPDSFTYLANDTAADSNVATVTLDVGAANRPPVADDDSYAVDEDQTLTVAAPGVLGNDTDADGDALTVAEVMPPTHGTLTLNPDGSFEYAPDANFHGTDSFTYLANDGSADSDVATVTIEVASVNDAPVAHDDAYNTDEDQTLTVAAPGVLGNDTDADGDALTAAEVAPPTHGTLTLNPDGSFEYVPDGNFHGTDSFTYLANDGSADSNVATVTTDVGVVNHPPVAVDDTAATDEDTAVSGNVLGNDSDPDAGDTVTVIGADAASAAGVPVTVSPGGEFTYDPSGRFDRLGEGETVADTFTYTIGDGNGGTDTATVTVTITGVNDAPVARAGGPYGGQAGQVITFDAGASSDVDGQIVEHAWDWDSDGTWDEITAAGSVDHVWAAAYSGTVTLRVTDDGGLTGSDSAQVDITDAGLPESVDDLVTVTFGRVSYDPRTRRFGASVTVTNTSSSAIGSPVYLAVENISQPNITVANADGTIGGAAYVDLSGLLGDAQLAPGEAVSAWVYFDNPDGVRFTFNHRVLGMRPDPAGGASVGVSDSFFATGDAAGQFGTPLSEYRPGAADSPLVRPALPDARQYVDVTNTGDSPLILHEIRINAPDVTVDVTLTADASDDIVLQPGQTQRLNLTYAPSRPTPGDATTQEFDVDDGLVILTSAADRPVYQIALRGASTFNSDVSYEGVVGLGDLGWLNANFGRTLADPGFDPAADINGDGAVNLGDLGTLNAEFGRQRQAVTLAGAGADAVSATALASAGAEPAEPAGNSETVAAEIDDPDVTTALAAGAQQFAAGASAPWAKADAGDAVAPTAICPRADQPAAPAGDLGDTVPDECPAAAAHPIAAGDDPAAAVDDDALAVDLGTEDLNASVDDLQLDLAGVGL